MRKNSCYARGLSILLTAALLVGGAAPMSTVFAEDYETEEWQEPSEELYYEDDSDDGYEDNGAENVSDDYYVDDDGAFSDDEPQKSDDAEYVSDAEYADDDEGYEEDTEADEEEPEAFDAEPEEPVIEFTDSEAEVLPVVAEAVLEIEPAADWQTFLSDLAALETYAEAFAEDNGEDADGLMINYIRTGVPRYQTDEWVTLAGAENTAFTAYVLDQDSQNGTEASGLRGIETITVPNGEEVEFSHLFGLLDIAYYNNGAETPFDLGSWAGDICDLIWIAARLGVTETEEEALVSEVREKYFGREFELKSTFSMSDVRSDLDGYFIVNKLFSTTRSLRTILTGYYTASLGDESRAVFFVKNRFPGADTRAKIRQAVYEAYTSNSGCSILEAKRGVDHLDSLRTASARAFADYIYELAEAQLPKVDKPLYTVFSSTTTTLAPGVTQTVNYAANAADKQIVYYIAKADVNRGDVLISANYANHDASTWRAARVTDQMAAAKEKHSDPSDAEAYIEGFEPIVGINADYYNMNTGEPAGALVIDGHIYKEGNGNAFFAVLKDGTPVIADGNQWKDYRDQIEHAVSGAQILIRNGKITTGLTPSANSGYPETCVGITEDGQVVFMAIDGRQEPFSAGGSAAEFAMIMYEAGCVWALGLDGGGSTTFAAKQEGADKVTVVNSPSDGYERSVASSLMIVSTQKTSTDFHHARVTVGTSYLTPGAKTQVSAVGVSSSGHAADIPEGAEWAVSDDRVISVSEDGELTALSAGDAEVRLMVKGETAGKRTVHVVAVPNSLTFEKTNMHMIYGVAAELPLVASYNGNPVEISPEDILFSFDPENAGSMEGFSFTGDEESGVRNVTVTATLKRDLSISAEMELALYSNGEAIFDFDDATSGDRQFAWDRDVTNTETEDEKYYHISDPDQSIDISYIFALDIESLPIPPQLEPLLSIVAGGDVSGVSPWKLLLQLAERVNTMTNVRITMDLDENLDFDITDLLFVNDYFRLTDAAIDEEQHKLTMTINFIKQSEPIDAASANPICIVSGIKGTPKEDAAWDEKNCLEITNSGKVKYDIYLRASALYSFASIPENQETYGLYPFVDTVINPTYGTYDAGGHFMQDYTEFEDRFTLDSSVFNGWKKIGDDLYYFERNKAVTGIREVPGYNDEGTKYYYDFGDNGVSRGKVTGLFTLEDGLHYAVLGLPKTGWRTISAEGSEIEYYYFDTKKGTAVDGEQTIAGYHYLFENYRLVRGDFVTDSKGSRYRWAGYWLKGSWFEHEGSKYYVKYNSEGYVVKDGLQSVYAYGAGTRGTTALFDEHGVWLEDFSGLYTDKADNTYLIDKGELVVYPGLVKVGEYYYYFKSSNTAVKSRTYWPTKTNGLLPLQAYIFDEQGRITNPPDPAEPGPEPEPDPEPTPDPPVPVVKNGIVSERGSLYYYENGVLKPAGLIKLGEDYYYVRTSTGEVIHGRSYWASVTNGLLPERSYSFGEDGKMIDPPGPVTPDPEPEPEPEPGPEPDPTPAVKNGIVSERGSLYYYENGVLKPAGLIKIGKDYYYVRTSTGEVVHGRSYWATVTNGLLPEKMYVFAEDGKLKLN